jgi:predicted Fe-Mo cluster-binding NifX family protein
MNILKIAIPLADGRLTAHFGHCRTFAVLTANTAEEKILSQEELVPPPHEPGLLPKWLADQKVGLIIAGGMGDRAQELFRSFGIEVLAGAPALAPEELVRQYLTDTLRIGENECDH